MRRRFLGGAAVRGSVSCSGPWRMVQVLTFTEGGEGGLMLPILFTSTLGFSGLTLAHSTSTFRSQRCPVDTVIPFHPQTPIKIWKKLSGASPTFCGAQGPTVAL